MMSWLRGRIRALRTLFAKGAVERELEEELEFHIAMTTEQNIRAGMSPEAARRAALLEFGGVERFKEEVRSVRSVRFIEDVIADLRYAWRMLVRKPGFTLAAVLTIALGVGGTTAVFSVVDALFLRPPGGVVAADELVRIRIARNEGMVQTGDAGGSGSYVDYEAIRESVPALSGAGAYMAVRDLDLGAGEDAEQVRGRAATSTFFSVLGVKPEHGRLLVREEDGVAGAHPVVVLSHSFWKRRFGADASILGRNLELNGQRMTVVGVADDDFADIDPEPVDLWYPISMLGPLGFMGMGDTPDWRTQTAMLMIDYIGRRAPGADVARVESEATAALVHAAESAPDLDPTPQVMASPILAARGPQRTAAAQLSLVLAVVAGLVLLIACANVANLLLARSSTRRRELALRLSLGAGRGRLFRQHLTESLLLALIGGLGGVFVAFLASGLVRQFPLPPKAGQLDARMLLFALGVSLLTGLIFGLLPAVRSAGTEPSEGLKEARSGATVHRARLHRSLVVLQVSLSVLLLVGAALFIQSLRAVTRIDSGVDLERLMTISVDLKRLNLAPEQREEFYAAAQARARAVPGIEKAAMVHFSPFAGMAYGANFTLPPREDSVRVENGPYLNLAGPGFFEAAGIRLLAGRDFTAADASGTPTVIVNEAMANVLVRGGQALGICFPVDKQVREGGCSEVVGIVATARHNYMQDEQIPFIYVPRDRTPARITWGGPTLLLRVRDGADPSIGEIRTAIQSLRPDLPFVRVRPLEEQIRSQVLPYRLGATLFTLFGALALVLAAVGLYGVLAYFVAERTAEIGVRRALGAPAASVVRLVAKQGLVPVGIGVVVGLAAAFVAAKLVAALLFGVEARDPLTFGMVAVFLLVVGALAAAIPARRAARVDPMIALRQS